MSTLDKFLIEEAKEKGQLVSMVGVVFGERTDLNTRLSEYFKRKIPDYFGVFKNGDAEKILARLNDLGVDELKFPKRGEHNYLISITRSLDLRVVVANYKAKDSYEKYVIIETFVISEDATERDVDKLVSFLTNYILSERFVMAL